MFYIPNTHLTLGVMRTESCDSKFGDCGDGGGGGNGKAVIYP